MDYAEAVARNMVRKPTNFTCTISDDSKDELLYAGHKISKVIGENYSVGETIGLLWFKERLPKWAAEFMEIVIKLCADHGPAVSGAHNTIVTARAGRDLMSAVASGMLTIGPRFGGAVAGAALMFKDAQDRQLGADEFISEMKKKNIKIQGIGHRIKSLKNPDQRVVLLKDFAEKNFPSTRLLNYALEVEQLTTAKKDTLILNVDGCIGVLSVDMMYSLGWSEDRIKSVVDSGGLNGLFLLGRTIGMIGHYMDQNRQKAALYRHPWDDILYDLPPLVE
jgi:ATP-citrate lyase alpha-subunit